MIKKNKQTTKNKQTNKQKNDRAVRSMALGDLLGKPLLCFWRRPFLLFLAVRWPLAVKKNVA